MGESGKKCHEVVDFDVMRDALSWQTHLRLVVIVMFMSEYNHTVDAKGRLIIPSKFREALGEEFVVSKGMDGCLFVYANEDWNAFEQKLTSLPLINKEARQFARFFLAGAARWNWTNREEYFCRQD